MVWVSGLAGTGKTCAVLDWLQSGSRSFAWLKMDGGNPDPGAFFARLSAAIEMSGVAPQFQAPVPNARNLRDMTAFVQRFVCQLASACAPETVLVIDDVHPIESSACFLAFVQAMAPCRGITLVLISRGQVPPALARLIVVGDLETVDFNRRSMGLAETAQLLECLGVGATEDQQEFVHMFSHGWPAAVALAGCVLRQHGTLNAQTIAAMAQLVHGFVADEVLPLFTDAEREALTTICWLPCVVTHGHAFSADMALRSHVQELTKNGALMRCLGEHRYALHPLLQGALKQWCQQHLQEAEIRQRVRRCIHVLQVHGDWDAAADLALEHRMYDLAVNCLQHIGQTALDAGQHESIATRLRALPEDALDGRLLMLTGQALMPVNGALAGAYLTRALQAFLKTDQQANLRRLLLCSAPALMASSQFAAAWEQCLVSTTPDSAGSHTEASCQDVLPLAYLRAFSPFARRGREVERRGRDRHALDAVFADLMHASTPTSVLASMVVKGLVSGDLSLMPRIQAMLGAGIVISQDVDGYAVLIEQIMQICNVHAEVPRPIGWPADSDTDPGPLRLMQALVHVWHDVQRNQRTTLPDWTKRLEQLALSPRDPWFGIVFAAWRFKLHHESGRQHAAAQVLQQLELLCRCHSASSACVLAMQAKAALIPSMPAGERSAACQALRGAAACEMAPGLSITADILEAAYLLDVDPTRASDSIDRMVNRLLRRIERHGCSSLVWADRDSLSKVLTYALVRQRHVNLTQQLIRRFRLPASAASPVSWPHAVRIQCCGPFTIWVDGQLYKAARKASHRQLELLKGLAATVGEPQAAQSIADRMWPDVTSSIAMKNLQTTVTRLRSLLGYPLVSLQHGIACLDPSICHSDSQELFESMDRLDGMLISQFKQEQALFATASHLLRLTRRSVLEGETVAWLRDISAALERRALRLVLRAVRQLAVLNSHEVAMALVEQVLEQHPQAPGANDLFTTLVGRQSSALES